jgi:hypothetical protein
MRLFRFALIALGLSALLTQTLSAAQVLVVASNGKWDMEYDPYGNVNTLGAKAIAACQAKGGTDSRIVWSISSSVQKTHARIMHVGIAISDNGTGTIVGWSAGMNIPTGKRAKEDCLKKGGQNPKVVAKF